MNAYREHTAPQETPEEYLARIECQKLEDARKHHDCGEVFATPPIRPAVPMQANGLTMAPMEVILT